MRPGDGGAVSELCQRLVWAQLVHGALTQLSHQQTESAAVTTCSILRCTGQIEEGTETSDVGARSWESSPETAESDFNALLSIRAASQVGSAVKKKNLPANSGGAGETDSVPGLGRSPGGGNSNPLQYSCLENSMDTGAWWAPAHGVAKNQTRLSTTTTFQLFRT